MFSILIFFIYSIIYSLCAVHGCGDLPQSAADSVGRHQHLHFKRPEGDPFAHGHCRASEIAVEEFFGRLRVQSPSASLTCRGYWQAAARAMVKDHRASKKRKLVKKAEILKPISPQDFMICSERAWDSGLKLVSSTSCLSVASLQELYKAWCAGGNWRDSEAAELDGSEDEQDELDAECGVHATASLVQTIGSEATMHEDLPVDAPEPDDLVGELDEKELRSVIFAGQTEDPCQDDESYGMPKTLHQAVDLLPPGASETELFDKIFRLTMYLRYWRGGGDTHWVPNPRAARRKCSSQKLNWYQCLGVVNSRWIIFHLIFPCISMYLLCTLAFFVCWQGSRVWFLFSVVVYSIRNQMALDKVAIAPSIACLDIVANAFQVERAEAEGAKR